MIVGKVIKYYTFEDLHNRLKSIGISLTTSSIAYYEKKGILKVARANPRKKDQKLLTKVYKTREELERVVRFIVDFKKATIAKHSAYNDDDFGISTIDDVIDKLKSGNYLE